jgi:hypothetical protein
MRASGSAAAFAAIFSALRRVIRSNRAIEASPHCRETETAHVRHKPLDPMFAGGEGLAARPAHILIEGCAGLAGAEPQTWGTGLMDDSIFVGLDVHKATAIARELAGFVV